MLHALECITLVDALGQQMKKNLDSRKINKLGWSQKIGLEEGLKEVIKYRSN